MYWQWAFCRAGRQPLQQLKLKKSKKYIFCFDWYLLELEITRLMMLLLG